MMALTHAAFSVAISSLCLSTDDPVALAIAAIASQLPDIDTSKSTTGRLFFPISAYLEKNYPHRTITHSFLASGLFTVITYPIALFINPHYWQALVLGFFLGWFADAFTKSGVAAFYPGKARLVIPGNPRLRLSTGSNIEWFVLFLLVAIATVSININLNGGMLRQFDQILGIPTGAIEIVNEDISKYLLEVKVKGYNSITTQPIDSRYEVIQALSQNDLLVKDSDRTFYRVGRSQQSQIIANQIKVKRIAPIVVTNKNLYLDDEDIYQIMQQINQPRTYISGTLTIEDGEDLNVPTHIERFNNITLQPTSNVVIARILAAPPKLIAQKLGDYYGTGNLIIRTISVRQKT